MMANKVMHKHRIFADNGSIIWYKKGECFMAKTLYVGNLPWSTTESILSDAFQNYGNVLSSRIITDSETGRSRGFGFVEVDDADAPKIVTAMNETDFGGRQIVVNEAKPREQ